jgi:hypothetical protein
MAFPKERKMADGGSTNVIEWSRGVLNMYSVLFVRRGFCFDTVVEA